MNSDSAPSSKQILIVDDTPANLRLLAELLSEHGYTIRLAPSGKLALMSIRQSLPDLILLDIRMPTLSGYELCRQLKANQRTCNIPIIFLSALKAGEDKVKAFAMGGADYITKPFQAEEVSARVQHQLQLLDLQRQLENQNRQLQQEISDRKQAQAELRRERNLLRTLMNAIPDMVFFKNLQGQYLFWNQAFQAFTGKDFSQIWQHTDADLFSAQGAERTKDRDQHVLASATPLRYEETATFPDQEQRSLDTYKVPVHSDAGELVGLIGICRDVTRRKTDERALIQTSRALQTFSHNLKQLHRLSLQQFPTFAELATDYLKTGCQIMNFAGGLISTIRQDTYVIEAIETTLSGMQKGFSCNLSDTYCAEAIRTRRTIAQPHFGNTDRATNHPVYQALQLESFISTPIVVNGEIYGSLCFFSTEIRTAGFGSHEKEIVELMAQSISKYLRSDQIEQQRNRAVTALQESEERFRQLAEHIDSVFWIAEPSEQRFTYVSPAYETIWGQPCKAVLQDARHWQSTIYPEDLAAVAAKQFTPQSYEAEYRIQHPDGKLRWIRDRAFPVYDATGQPYRVVGIAEDITDIKHQEQSLRLIFEGTAAKTGSQFLQSLVRYLADVLQVRYALITQTISIDTPRVQIRAFWQDGQLGDSYALDLQGSPCERVLDGETVFHPDQVQSLYPQFQVFRDWNVHSYFGVPLINAHGKVIGNLAVLDDRPMRPEQTRELILKIFAARAGAELERQTFENALQVARESADTANQAKSEFLASISHELRTPLNAILGFTQLILNDYTIDTKSHDYLDIVYRSGEHLLTLINDVLEMSKIEAGKLALISEPFDLHKLLHDLKELFELRAQAKHLTLIVTCDADVPQYIEADENKLRQVLINLLSNAVKFTQNGQVTLEVSRVSHPDTAAAVTKVSQSPTMVIAFAVVDTGPGIAPDELDLLFAPFTQTRAGYRSHEGTGLGLSISQRFVQLMGGQIQVQTELNQGSTFTFCIQASPASDTAALARPMPVTQAIEALAPGQPAYRILVVEDQPANQLLLVRILESAGFVVKAVADGQSAVAAAQDWHPHLIWMDIRMPNLDGHAATRQIRAMELTPKPVIIALTANVFEDEQSRVLAAGCNAFVRKPFTANQIFQTMAQYLPIQYVYQTASETPLETTAANVEPVLLSFEGAIAACSELSPRWVQSMRRATIKGADAQILELLAELPAHQAELAKTLRCWVQDYQFDTILNVLPTE